MKAPGNPALRGLQTALAAASASPSGGDFTEQNLKDVEEAINWLYREVPSYRLRQTSRTLNNRVNNSTTGN